MSNKLFWVVIPWLGAAAGAAAVLAGCGPPPAPVAPPPEPTAVAAEPVVEPEPAPTAAPDAGAADGAAEPAEALPTQPPSSGRPAILMGPSDKISSPFGATPGAVLKLKAKGSKEPFVLVIPEFSLRTGYDITFEGAPNIKRKNAVGPVFHLVVKPQEKRKSIRVDTQGKPFEWRVPTFGKETVNLAYGEVTRDGAGQENVKWTVHGPRNVDKSFGVAYFYVSFLSEAYVHGTTAPPSAAAGPAAE